jgi:hypothetical protein
MHKTGEPDDSLSGLSAIVISARPPLFHDAIQALRLRLRAEVACLKMERNILGKAAAYFSRGQRRSMPILIAGVVSGQFVCSVKSSRSQLHWLSPASCAPQEALFPSAHEDEALRVHMRAIHAELRGAIRMAADEA